MAIAFMNKNPKLNIKLSTKYTKYVIEKHW